MRRGAVVLQINCDPIVKDFATIYNAFYRNTVHWFCMIFYRVEMYMKSRSFR